MSGMPGRWSARITQRVSLPAAGFCAGTLLIDALLFLDVPRDSRLFPADFVLMLHRSAVCVLALLAVAMLLCSYRRTLRSLVVVHALIVLFLVIAFHQSRQGAALLLFSQLAGCVAYESFPSSLISAAASSLVLVGCILATGFPPSFVAALAVGAGTLAVAGSYLGKYREETIALHGYVDRLKDNVAALTRATSISQDYARSVEAETIAAERMRLTRDIHDAVGYTFTNNLIMMEAVKVMVRREPERVREHIERMRRNTEEGLEQIRRTLRDLRGDGRAKESLWGALRKLVRVYSLSTGTRVKFELGNMDVASLEPYRDVVHHFVQEGLINSFRHGRADRATILMWDYGEEFRVTLEDNGAGCSAEIRPGIGITGMQERASQHGGRVAIDNVVGGFRISIYLRKGGGDGPEGPALHR